MRRPGRTASKAPRTSRVNKMTTLGPRLLDIVYHGRCQVYCGPPWQGCDVLWVDYLLADRRPRKPSCDRSLQAFSEYRL